MEKSMAFKMKSFKEFQVTEKMGVPTGIMGLSKELTDLVIEILIKNNFNAIEDKEIEYKVNDAHPDFEVQTVKMLVSFLATPFSNRPIAVEGIYDPSETTLKRVYISANITIDLVKMVSSTREDLVKDMRAVLEGHIYHELLHAYEDRQRTLKKKFNRLIFSKGHVPAQVSVKLLQENPRLHPLLREFLFLVYLTTSHEVRARVTQAYPFIRDIEDSKERLKALKQTMSWEFSEMLTNFSGEKFIENFKKNN